MNGKIQASTIKLKKGRVTTLPFLISQSLIFYKL